MQDRQQQPQQQPPQQQHEQYQPPMHQPSNPFGGPTSQPHMAGSSATSSIPSPAKPSPAPTAVHTGGSESAEWKEFKDPSGRPYYHNKNRRITTYDKPDCLKSFAERTLPPCKWKEYPTNDGKKYYSDGEKSVWTEPPELTAYKTQLAAMESGGVPPTAAFSSPVNQAAGFPRTPANTGVGQGMPSTLEGAPSNSGSDMSGMVSESALREKVLLETDEPVVPVPIIPLPVTTPSTPLTKREKKELVNQEPLVFNSQEERVEAFTKLLLDTGITSTNKWVEVTKLCNKDQRWNALTTIGQRKQVFAEYQTRRMKDEKEEKRLRQRKARDGFFKMLAEDTSIDVKTRWREAQGSLSTDERYTNVEDDREREDLFNEFVTELARKHDEQKRSFRKAREKGFMAFLKENKSEITHTSKWSDSREKLEDKKDPRFEAMDESDRRNMFHDYVSDLRKESEAEIRVKEKEKEKLAKENRDAFRAFLKQKVKDGKITAESRWRDLKVDLEKEAAYKAMDGQSGAPPRELFDDLIDDLQYLYRADRKVGSPLPTYPVFFSFH